MVNSNKLIITLNQLYSVTVTKIWMIRNYFIQNLRYQNKNTSNLYFANLVFNPLVCIRMMLVSPVRSINHVHCTEQCTGVVRYSVVPWQHRLQTVVCAALAPSSHLSFLCICCPAVRGLCQYPLHKRISVT